MSQASISSRLPPVMSRLGFDVSSLPFTLRTALGACAALLLGWLMGLDHPQWAAMSVWAASQPLRGQIFEKSLSRMAGTVVGVIAGVAFLLMSGGDPLILAIAVSVWTALCAAAGNLQRGYLAYGVTLAGYSAAMVALLDIQRPEHIMTLAADRLLTVLLGVVVAMVVGLLFAPPRAEGVTAARTRNLTARLLRAMASDLRGAEADDRTVQPLLAEAALIDEALEPQSPGSPGTRREAKALRRILAAQVSAIVWLRRPATASAPSAGAANALNQAAEVLEGAQSAEDAVSWLERASDAAVDNPDLRETLLRLETAVRDRVQPEATASDRPRRLHPGVLHRDWVGAREAGLRSLAVMLLMGAVWVVTDWSTGPYLMLGAAVMTTVFSSMDFPARTIAYVFRGAALGVLGALVCRWLVWPMATQPIDLILLTLPFMLIGPVLMAHRKTGEGAFDYNMHLLLLLAPVFPLSGGFSHSLAVAAAVVAGPGAALLGYRLIYPATISRRMDTLIGMMIREVQVMARSPDAAARSGAWNARLQHRMLRLSRWIDKTGAHEISAVGGGLAILTLGEAVMALHRLGSDPALSATATRQTHIALDRIRNLEHGLQAAITALKRAAEALPDNHANVARLLQDAAAAATSHPAFFRRILSD